MQVLLYTDGAAIPTNPGPGGYGCVLICGDQRKEISESYRWTTNNRMELMGLTVGLRTLEDSCRLTIISDSQYVLYPLTKGWIKTWKAKGWRSKKGNSIVKNLDLWMELDQLLSRHEFYCQWIKGHTGGDSVEAIENQRCDTLANQAAIRAGKNPDHFDYIYERITGYRPSVGQATVPIQLSPEEHESMIRSELVWADSEDEYADVGSVDLFLPIS